MNMKNQKCSWTKISLSVLTFPEEIIKRYCEKLNWKAISEDLILSEEWIDKYQNNVSWYHIFRHQKLSESFMEKTSRSI